MNNEELLEFYENHKDYSFQISFYSMQTYFTLEDLIKLTNILNNMENNNEYRITSCKS